MIQLRISRTLAMTEAFVDTYNNSHHLKEDKNHNKKKAVLAKSFFSYKDKNTRKKIKYYFDYSSEC